MDNPPRPPLGTTEPGHHSLTLSDGTTILTRPIQPTDAAALQRFHSRLSSESIYRRFFESLPVLSPQLAAHFTDLDGVDRYALVALDPAQPTEIIAVVRYDREPGTDGAEYAIVVEDHWQGRGLGHGLTRQLVAVAMAVDIHCLHAFVLAENSGMLTLLRHLGYPAHTSMEGGCLRLDLDLPTPTHEAGLGAAPQPAQSR